MPNKKTPTATTNTAIGVLEDIRAELRTAAAAELSRMKGGA